MLVITLWAVLMNERHFLSGALDGTSSGSASYWLLAIVNGVVFVLAVWMVVEGIISIWKPENETQS
jgi:hypothetical protein